MYVLLKRATILTTAATVLAMTAALVKINQVSTVFLQFKNNFNRGVKHDFPFIDICKVPREVLTTEGEARGFQPS